MAGDELFETIKAEHQGLLNQLRNVANVTTLESARRLLERLDYSLGNHFDAEEACIYSWLNEHPASRRLAEAGKSEHNEIRHLIWRIAVEAVEAVDGTDWHDQLIEVHSILEQHVWREEKELFPLLRERFTESELDVMRTQYVSYNAEVGPGKAA